MAVVAPRIKDGTAPGRLLEPAGAVERGIHIDGPDFLSACQRVKGAERGR